jgi:hypothetical protein
MTMRGHPCGAYTSLDPRLAGADTAGILKPYTKSTEKIQSITEKIEKISLKINIYSLRVFFVHFV